MAAGNRLRLCMGKDLAGGEVSRCRQTNPNVALRNPSFRNYADYMLSSRFHEAINRLVERAQQTNTAIMCAEHVYFRCHRMLVSDTWQVADTPCCIYG